MCVFLKRSPLRHLCQMIVYDLDLASGKSRCFACETFGSPLAVQTAHPSLFQNIPAGGKCFACETSANLAASLKP
jgi:hypothetical protein